MPRAVVDEILVNFIGEDEEVVLDGEGGDGFEFGGREDFAAGVRGRVDDDAAGAGRDGGAEGVEVHRPAGRGEGDGCGVHAQGAQGVQVIAVKRFEEDDFVAGIEEGHAGGLERGRRAGGDQDFAVRIGGHAVVACQLFGDRLAEGRDAVEAGVDVQALGDGFDGAGGDGLRDFGIADALGQVNAADAVAFDGHGANFRLDQAGRDGAEAEFLGYGLHWSRISQLQLGAHLSDSWQVGTPGGWESGKLLA